MTPTNEATMREEFDAWVDTDPVFDPRSPLSIAWLAWQAARAASPDPPLDVGHLRSRFMSWLQQGCAPVDAFDKTMRVIAGQAASPDPAPVKGEPLEAGNVWQCQIGYAGALPKGADGPMRSAICDAFRQLSGHDPKFLFSGWGHKLDEKYLAVVEDRAPNFPPCTHGIPAGECCNDCVICPGCCHQFEAIPINVQARLNHPAGMAEDAERLDRLQRLCFEYRNAASADAETWWQEIRALVTRRALQGNG